MKEGSLARHDMNGIARLENVQKSYRLGKLAVPALRDVTLTLERGGFLSLAGPSGSGKTTLLNLLGALDTPTSGRVVIGGMSTDGLDARTLADFRNAKLGFIFQTFNLIPVLTAAENVEFPLHLLGIRAKTERQRRVGEMLEAVGLGGLAERRPTELSGGQQQRVAIARALIKGPEVVLADEPTANLDSDTAREIMALMRGLNERLGTTFVFSTHDPLVMEHATRVIRLRDGRVESDERSHPERSGA